MEAAEVLIMNSVQPPTVLGESGAGKPEEQQDITPLDTSSSLIGYKVFTYHSIDHHSRGA